MMISMTLTDDQQIREGEEAATAWVRHADEARACIIPMARGLLAARRKYPADRDFGDWFGKSLYARCVNEHNRAALISLGEHEEASAAFIRTTCLISPRSIWEALAPVIEGVKVDTVGLAGCQTGQTLLPRQEYEENQEVNAMNDQTISIPATKSKLNLPKGKAGRAFAGLPKADLVAGHYLNKVARSKLGKLIGAERNGRAVWSLLVDAIESGAFGEPTEASHIGKLNVRVLAPWTNLNQFERLNLADPGDRKLVREILFPIVAELPELRTNPLEVEREFWRRLSARDEKAREVPMVGRRQERLDRLAQNESEVIAFGVPLWPFPHDNITPPYTYLELIHAVWYSEFLQMVLHRDEPKGRAMTARHLTKYLSPIAPGFTNAVRHIFNAYEANPEGEKKFPMQPLNFGS